MATDCLLQDYKSLKCLYVHAGGLGLNSCGFRLESKGESIQSVRNLCAKLNQKKKKRKYDIKWHRSTGSQQKAAPVDSEPSSSSQVIPGLAQVRMGKLGKVSRWLIEQPGLFQTRRHFLFKVKIPGWKMFSTSPFSSKLKRSGLCAWLQWNETKWKSACFWQQGIERKRLLYTHGVKKHLLWRFKPIWMDRKTY